MRKGESVPKALARCTVLDREGRAIELASLWAKGPTLLVFLRHFGCLCLSAQMTELVPRLFDLHKLGMRTVFIGNGPPHQIDTFIERFLLVDKPVEIVTDPSLTSFRAAGLVRSWWAIFGPKALWEVIRALGHGHINRWGQGDNLQQGGILLVDAEGKVAWYYRNLSIGGHPPSVEIVDAAIRTLLKQSPLLI